MKYAIVTALFLFPFYLVLSAMPANAAWYAHSFTDDFDGGTIWNATSDSVKPTDPMSFPYYGTKAHIIIGKEGGELFAGIWFSGPINLTGGRLGVYTNAEQYKIPAMIDGERKTITMYKMYSEDDVLRVRYVDWFIQQVRNNDTIKIKLQWYGSGSVVYVFHTDGANKAMDKFID